MTVRKMDSHKRYKQKTYLTEKALGKIKIQYAKLLSKQGNTLSTLQLNNLFNQLRKKLKKKVRDC